MLDATKKKKKKGLKDLPALTFKPKRDDARKVPNNDVVPIEGEDAVGKGLIRHKQIRCNPRW